MEFVEMRYRVAINFLLILIFFAQGALGQDWFRGSVLLQNGNVVHGEISFWTGRDAIFLSEGEVVMAIPAFRIQSFTFFDRDSETQRHFVTVPGKHGAATTFQFYELVVEGPVSVVRQQHLYWYSLRLQASDYDYFVVKDDQFLPINKFRRELYPELKRTSSSLEHYAEQKRLSLYNVDDTILLIQYYNSEQTGMASIR